MSLINEFLQDCILMDKKRTSDGEGGFITEWVEGAKIQAAIVRDTSMSARVAEKEGVTATYTITTTSNIFDCHTHYLRCNSNIYNHYSQNSKARLS